MSEEKVERAQYGRKVCSTIQDFISKETDMEDILDKLSKITNPIAAIVIIAFLGMEYVTRSQESPKGN